jgi:nucleotide-binding universal stress UspA family protein
MRLMIAVDDSEQATAVVGALQPLFERERPEVELVSIVDMSDVHEVRRSGQPAFEPTPAVGASAHDEQQPPPQLAESHGQALERVRIEREDFLRNLASGAGLDGSVTVISDEHTADAITRHASESGADLVAVGTHGRSGISRVLMGSVAEHVVRHCEVPVIVVRQGMRAPETGA